ncbi:MAG: hypothetical protein AAFQ68_11335 [Bacteroidota bacterium]
MNRLYRYKIIFWLCLIPLLSWAQTPGVSATSSLRLLAKYHEGNILLRWAPDNPADWQEGHQSGYWLERMELDPESPNAEPDYQLIHAAPIRPKSLAQIKQLSEQAPANDYLLVIAECIYGKGQIASGLAGDWLSASDELANRYSFSLFAADMDFDAALAAGLAFVDEDVQSNKQYLYRLRLATDRPQRPAFEQLISQAKESMQPQIQSILEQEGRVVLQWNRQLHERHFSSYLIERSRNGQSYETLNQRPYVHGLGQAAAVQTNLISYQAAANYEQYYYRIIGIDPFGQRSAPSPAVLAMSRDRTPPASPTMLQTTPDPEQKIVKLEWQAGIGGEAPAAYQIRRSFDFKGELLPLHQGTLPASQLSFTDENPNFVGINYYQVVALDTAGNEAYSQVVAGYIIDLEPPSKPEGLAGTIDSLGVVRLRWEENPEPDVKGYKVFFANSRSEVFNALYNKAVAGNKFQDTIVVKTLAQKIHYRVVAVDARGNLSAFSEILTLQRPDKVAPAVALFGDYQVQQATISLRWIASSSIDLESQQLYRQSGDREWQLIRSFLPDRSSYLDQDIKPNTVYRYRIESIDFAQNKSLSKTIELRSKQVQLSNGQKLAATPLSDENSIQLVWQSAQEVKRWVLYRAVGDGPLVSIQSIPAQENEFRDTSVRQGQTYRYALRAVYPDGRKSPLGSPISSRLPK